MASKIEKNCGGKCRSKQHGLELITAISRGTLSQVQLYLRTCHNPILASDSYGRTALHVAASFNKCDVVEWLVEEMKAELGVRDQESGWTALHRSLFYGNLASARLLISLGASVSLRDKEGLTPLDIVMKDRLPHVEFIQSGLQEVYTWGDNSNFTLGHDSELRKKTGEVVDYFRKNNISIKMVSMSKYHTAFLSTEGHAYSCGHGRGGRLGLGNEQTHLTPEKIELREEEVISVSSGKDHTVFLTEKGNLYSCGLNEYHQLGQTPPPTNSLTPKLVNAKILKGKKIVGVSAQRYHTAVYTSDHVYTFGLNAGQLGHMKVAGEPIVSQPKLVSALNHKGVQIKLLTASDAATIVVTTKGDVYALHEYQCRKIVSKRLDICDIAACGGNLDHSMNLEKIRERGGNELIVAFLNTSGKVYVWFGHDQVLKRCSWVLRRPLHITMFTLSPTRLAFITKEGEAFVGSLPKYRNRETSISDKDIIATSPPKQRESLQLSVTELVEKDDVYDIRVERFPNLHRATYIVSDTKGLNFTVLQAQPNASLIEIPSTESSEMRKNLRELLTEADQYDLTHDVLLEVGNERIPAHKYILAYRSEYFRKMFTAKDSDLDTRGKPVVPLEGADPALFSQLLTYIYTDTCDLVSVGHNVPSALLGNPELAEIKENIGNYVDVNFDGRNMSAFAVQSKIKGKGKKGGKQAKQGSGKSGKQGSEQGGARSRNPVKDLQELAKKFGVKSLVKRLEAVKFSSGTIHSVPGRHLPFPAPKFDREKFSKMYDVCITCEDGQELRAHKCVLVARMQYFRSMMGNVWMETTDTDSLSLPFPSDILEVVLDFLYKDDTSVIDCYNDAEFLCNVLVLADSFLLERLKNMCEVAIATLVTLKNCGELLEFASDYNASQLKRTCQQYITINLGALLEARVLDVLSPEVMDELTEYYQENVPGMNKRKLTPYSGIPDAETLERFEAEFSETPDDSSAQKVKKDDSAKKGKPKRRRTKSRTISQSEGDKKEPLVSVSSETGFNLELEEMEEADSPTSPVESPRSEDSVKEKPLISETLKQKSWVCRKLELRENKTATPPADPVPGPQSPVEPLAEPPGPKADLPGQVRESPETDPGPMGLREIMAQQASTKTSTQNSGTGESSGGKKHGRLSQKERKKLMQKSVSGDGDSSVADDTRSETVGIGAKPKAAWGAPANPWSKPQDQSVQSFRDLVNQEERAIPSLPRQTVKPAPRAPRVDIKQGAGDASFSWGLSSRGQRKARASTEEASPQSPGESPSSPGAWGVISPGPVTPILTDAHPSFSEIIRDEEQQKETLVRTTNKPLALIQIEEQAIAELMEHYGAGTNHDEHITVQRVPTTLATPTWAATQRQQP